MVSVHDQFLKALLERFPHPGIAAVLQELPDELAAPFRTLPAKVGKAPETFFAQARPALRGMHPSWCEELVAVCPEVLQPLIRRVILEAVGKEKSQLPISDFVRNFLLRYAIDKWPERSIEGIEAIEGTSFRWLALCDEAKLMTLAELLAVNDVVDVVRQIVDKKILQKILNVMTPLQQRYVRALLHRPVRAATLNKELTAILLDDPVKGSQVLLKKGFEELALALKDEPQLLRWHVLHRIDRATAMSLTQAMESAVSAKHGAEMKKNLAHAYQFLQKVKKQ